MRIAVISDLHANLQATTEVLNLLETLEFDELICLGDFVGYGPNPNEVIDLIRKKNIRCVWGNHDGGVTGKQSLGMFMEPNRSLLQKTSEIITPENLKWLTDLPNTIEGDNWLAAHATPVNPTSWIYLDNSVKCMEALNLIDDKFDFIFVGHTHRPGFVGNEFGLFNMEEGYKYVVNPGSVGQSRDGDLRASFCIVDTVNFNYKNYRVNYDIEKTLEAYDKLKIDSRSAQWLLRV